MTNPIFFFNKDLGEDQIKVPIPLPNVSGKILEKLIEYCQYYYDNKISADYKKDDITDWERSYCEIDQSFLFELILVCIFIIQLVIIISS